MKETFHSSLVIDSILDWFVNSYEYCQSIESDAYSILSQARITNPQYHKDLITVMTKWLENDNGVRSDMEKSLDFDSNVIILFINHRTNFFDLPTHN